MCPPVPFGTIITAMHALQLRFGYTWALLHIFSVCTPCTYHTFFFSELSGYIHVCRNHMKKLESRVLNSKLSLQNSLARFSYVSVGNTLVGGVFSVLLVVSDFICPLKSSKTYPWQCIKRGPATHLPSFLAMTLLLDSVALWISCCKNYFVTSSCLKAKQKGMAWGCHAATMLLQQSCMQLGSGGSHPQTKWCVEQQFSVADTHRCLGKGASRHLALAPVGGIRSLLRSRPVTFVRLWHNENSLLLAVW